MPLTTCRIAKKTTRFLWLLRHLTPQKRVRGPPVLLDRRNRDIQHFDHFVDGELGKPSQLYDLGLALIEPLEFEQRVI